MPIRNFTLRFTLTVLFLANLSSARAGVLYVDLNSTNPVPPFASWATAATNIQDAIDAAMNSDQVLVTNGVYKTGGRVVYALTNRIAITKPILVQSVNGPDVTSIQGFPARPGLRCAYLTNGAVLAGFSLSLGSSGSEDAGGDLIRDQCGGGVWCESYTAILSNCIVKVCSSDHLGGGVYGGTVVNSILQGNFAGGEGGGAYGANLLNCQVTNNSTVGSGGGIGSSSAIGTFLIGNIATHNGGSAFGSSLTNCTLVGSKAAMGGGAFGSTLWNSISYGNTAPIGSNHFASSLNHCCTAPLPALGNGNISDNPQFADLVHIATGSPCVGAGFGSVVTGTDMDGENWQTPPSMGCDEPIPGSIAGPLAVTFAASPQQALSTAIATGYPVTLTASVTGHASSNRWDFGDGDLAENSLTVAHVWGSVGNYPVVFTVFNDSNPGGVSATQTVHVTASVHFVALGSTNPVPPYSSWATAATNIQDAVDAAAAGGRVIVSNGVYQTGGRVASAGLTTNRLFVNKPVIVTSANGPAVTIIKGYQLPSVTNGNEAIRCVYLTSGSSLTGFTLTNGATRSENEGGGGVCVSGNAVVSNCVISGNSTILNGGGISSGAAVGCIIVGNWASVSGGGAWSTVLVNCTLYDNSSSNQSSHGGGASGGAVINCTVTRNGAPSAGGVDSCVAFNSIIYDNNAPSGPNYSFTDLNYCCTSPLPAGGSGNIINAPQFRSASARDFRLRPGSPCINSGSLAIDPPAGDLDGNPRVAQGRIDVGAYEFQGVIHYVDLNGTNPVFPYTTWATAANGINDAIDAGSGGEFVVVSNGVYSTGGRTLQGSLTNRIVIDKPLGVFSANGPESTVIQGRQTPDFTNGESAIRGVYLADGASLDGFTISWGGTLSASNLTNDLCGGGIFAESSSAMIANCVIASNSAFGAGGGTFGGTLQNCRIEYNHASDNGGGAANSSLLSSSFFRNLAVYGGGASGCSISNCTLVQNIATASGGGSFESFLKNSIIVHNTAPSGPNFSSSFPNALQYCCTSPLPGDGNGNIVDVPFFVDENAGLLQLRAASSSCLDAGNNVYAPAGLDLAGNPRIYNGTVDMGAYEFQSRVHYVNRLGTNPVTPYTSWATASTNLLNAANAATEGEYVSVTNGVYDTGGSVLLGVTNRLVVNVGIHVESVNGPAVTVIKGFQIPGITNGPSAVRCVVLGEAATLTGFTLTGGASASSGISGEQYGGGIYCRAYSSSVSNCIITGNTSADYGGGANGGTFYNCVFTGNSSKSGGAAVAGVYHSCLFTGNTAQGGGATAGGWLQNCTIVGNSASVDAGGCAGSTLSNSIIYYNSSPRSDDLYGGEGGSVVNYCCLPINFPGVGNFTNAPELASLSHLSAASPCLNAGGPATVPGTDIDGQPWSNPPSVGCDEFVFGQATGSLKVGIQASYTNVAIGASVDLLASITGNTSGSLWDFGDGTIVSNRPFTSHAWLTLGDFPVTLWAFNDDNPCGVSTTVIIHVFDHPTHYVSLQSTNPVSPYLSWATAATNIQTAVDGAYLGATVLVSNGIYQTGGRVVSGFALTNRVAVTKPLTLQSVNGPSVTTIQGFKVPGTTNGSSAVRCIYLGSGATLSGFTVRGGATLTTGALGQDQCGGGILSEPISVLIVNCVITSNSAQANGGGSFQGTLTNCVLSGNDAGSGGGGACQAVLGSCKVVGNRGQSGGGAASCSLTLCTVNGNLASFGGGIYSGDVTGSLIFGNTASQGGGVYQVNGPTRNSTIVSNSATSSGGGISGSGSVLENSIVYFNSAPASPNWVNSSISVQNVCLTPLAPGSGNITNSPLFVDQIAGNFRLQSNSPCIDAGTNGPSVGSTDLDGRPRVVSGTVDMGAFEFQGPGMSEFFGWLQQYNLPTDGSADFTDNDADGMNNWQEWRAGTIPTNNASRLFMLNPTPSASNVVVTWQSVTNKSYYLQRSPIFIPNPAFSQLATNIVGQAGTTSFTDTNAVNTGPYFYRVGVQ